MIREAQEPDMADVARLNDVVQTLHARARPDLYVTTPEPEGRMAILNKARLDPVWRLFLADQAGSVAGYVATERREVAASPLRHAHVEGHIHHICVSPDHQRRGFGRALIAAAVADLRARGVDRLTAAVWAFNAPSLALFQAAGFETAWRFLEMPLDTE